MAPASARNSSFIMQGCLQRARDEEGFANCKKIRPSPSAGEEISFLAGGRGSDGF